MASILDRPARRRASTRESAQPVVCSFSTRLGAMAFAVGDEKLLRLTFGHPSRAAAENALGDGSIRPAPGPWRELVERLQAFAEGLPQVFDDVPLADDPMPDFTARVLFHCRQIRYGETRTYQQLAAAAGNPRAARAVGQAMAKNRVPIIIPCHRVIAAAGHWGGFSAPQGVPMKRRLLALEAAGRNA